MTTIEIIGIIVGTIVGIVGIIFSILNHFGVFKKRKAKILAKDNIDDFNIKINTSGIIGVYTNKYVSVKFTDNISIINVNSKNGIEKIKIENNSFNLKFENNITYNILYKKRVNDEKFHLNYNIIIKNGEIEKNI